MVNSRPPDGHIDAVFGALADPTRRAIVERLMQGEATVGTVAEPHDMSLPSISRHVAVLERAGLIRRRVDGRQHWLELVPTGFTSAADWLTRYEAFWTGSLERLERLVAELAEPDDRRR